MGVVNRASRAAAVVLDRWSSLSHKSPMMDDLSSRAVNAARGWTPQSWIGDEHRRRLTAYMVLAAYDLNVAREFLQGTEEDRTERREYGDAGLVIDTTVSALIGDEAVVAVPGADAFDPDLPDTLDGPDVTPEEQAAHAELVTDNAEAGRLTDRQEWLRTWAEGVHLPLRMNDCERNAVTLGDGVYLLGWDDRAGQVVPSVMDPGFYFPVLPDTLDAYAFPERVHFAWEIPAEDFPDNKERVRRITYDLHELEPVVDHDAMDAAQTAEAMDAAVSLPDGAEWLTITEAGESFRVVVRRYPWQAADEEPSRMVCTVTDATWTLDDLQDASNVDAFDVSAADIRVEDGVLLEDLDLGIDFLPVIHVPNTPPGGDHYGQSSISRTVQLLDDLANGDTDTQRASATTGSPIIALWGAATGSNDPLTGIRGKPLTVAPGEVWKVGEGGGMSALDTSPNLAAGREYVLGMRDRLLVNSRLPASIVGTMDPSQAPSGFALQLSFGPLDGMIRSMRLVRQVKYALLLKFVQRISQANDALDPGETPWAEVTFGAYLPADQAGTLTMVKEARSAVPPLISLETAVRMLLSVGFPIDDVAEEVTAIEERDFTDANLLADATGDTAAVREFLGMPEEDTAAPVVAPVVGAVPAPGAPVIGAPTPAPGAGL